jgi:hypothetical protein
MSTPVQPTTEPTTKTSKQYGLQRPDGTILWGSGNIAGKSYAFEDLADELAMKERADLVRNLRGLAQQAGMDAKAYVDGHALVSRETITTVNPAVTEHQLEAGL